MRGRSGKGLVAPVPKACLEPPERCCGVVITLEKMKISILETTVEFFGLNWQLIELAS